MVRSTGSSVPVWAQALVGTVGSSIILYLFRQTLIAKPLRALCKVCDRPHYRKLFIARPEKAGTDKVRIQSGVVVGFSAPEMPEVVQFKGIPYASAARLSKPIAPKPWAGERDCSMYGPACFQNLGGLFIRADTEGVMTCIIDSIFGAPEIAGDRDKNHISLGELSEDCHNLNVFAPADRKALKPVFVWIHGGAYSFGSNTDGGLYHYPTLAEQHGTVVVTINYRLNAFGCLHVPKESVSNLALHDCLAALSWVQANIAQFGGDPSCVTIGGQSAGSMICSLLLSSKAASGLFHRCVCESGAAVGCSVSTAAEYEVMAGGIAKAMFKTDELPPLSEMRSYTSIEFNRLQDLMTFSPPHGSGGSGGSAPGSSLWRATVDGELVHKDGALAGLAEGPNKGAPLLIGWCTTEYAGIGSVPGVGPPGTRERAAAWIVPWLRGITNSVQSLEPTGHQAKWDAFALEFFDIQKAALEARGRAADVKAVCLSAASALWQVIPAMLTATAHANAGGTVYVYEFDFMCDEKKLPFAEHSSELAFLWNQVRNPLTRGQTKVKMGDVDERPALAKLSDDMQNAWAAFFRSGDPTTGPIKFPTLSPGAEKRIMILGRGEAAEHSMQNITAEWASFSAFYEKIRAFAAGSA